MRNILQTPPMRALNTDVESTTGVKPRYGIEGPWDKGDPVHEKITLAAIYQVKDTIGLGDANFTIGKDFRLSEFLRGVFWNDDPEVLMFDQDVQSSQNFSSGTLWGDHFEAGKISNANNKTNLTARSHFWDFQFLHGMATEIQEPALTTQQRILMWAEFVYKVAIGENVNGTNGMSTPELVANTILSDVKIPAAPVQGQSTIAGYFSTMTVPENDVTIRFLLTRGDPYISLDIGKRAIGSLMHLIEDSYAHGHVKRVLLNPTDLVSQTASTMVFQPNTYGNWGNVITFHAYKGQSDDHKAFDEYDKDTMDPTNPASFNGLVGANNAIIQCSALLKLFYAKTAWEANGPGSSPGPKALLKSIFTLDASATPANILVNQNPLSDLDSTGTGPGVTTTRDPNYLLGSNQAYLVTPNAVWVTPPAGAKWISCAANAQGGGNQDYSYNLKIDCSYCNLNTMVITGKCAADNSLTILVNNVVIPAPWQGGKTSVEFSALVPFAIAGHYFTNAVNTITFKAHNDPQIGTSSGSNPTGLLVAFDDISTMHA